MLLKLMTTLHGVRCEHSEVVAKSQVPALKGAAGLRTKSAAAASAPAESSRPCQVQATLKTTFRGPVLAGRSSES